MAEHLAKPVDGVAFCGDLDRAKIAARDSRSVATRATSTDHTEGRYMVGGRGGMSDKPVLVQRKGCDEQQFGAPAEELLVDGTSAKLAALKGQSISTPIPPPGDPVAPRAEFPQPQAPQAIPVMPIAQVPLDIPKGATLDQVAVSAPVAKKMVTIQGEGIGKLRVFCRDVVISQKLIVLAYPMDGSTAIAEPPRTNSDNLLTVTVDGKDYRCASYDLSFEFRDLLMVVLVRAAE